MRAFLGVALLLAVSASAFRTDYNMSEEEFEAEFGGKTDDADLEQRKADTLAKAEAEINQHNVQFEHGETEWFEEINGDSDKPLDIFIDSKTGVINVNGGRSFGAFDRALDDPLRVDAASEARIKALLDRAATPTSYDARTYGLISPVKNQQQCGSCCAFSTTAAIETSFYQTNGGAKGHVDLAEETFIDCAYNVAKNVKACDGAVPDGYLTAAPGITGGQYPHEYSDPYLNTSPKKQCYNITPLQWGAKVTDKTYTYSCNDTTMQVMISKYGAVVTTIDATLLQNYGGGIMNTKCSNPTVNHAVTAVGYGVDTDGKPYYIVKNSWGTGWGESGFFRIKTGICAFGGFCGVPLSTATGTYGTVPPMPAKATCDISKSVGTSTLTGTYNIQINGFKSTAKCTNSVCTPTTAQTNACYYMCGNIVSC